jgi:putative DNA primase/helicase
MQVPLEMAAVPALVGVSGVVGRRLGIRPKAKDDWLVIPNLWGQIVARPGKMKSPTLSETLQPIRKLASEAQLAHEEDSDAAGARLESLKAKEKAIKDRLKKEHSKGNEALIQAAETDLTEVRGEIRDHERDGEIRRYVVNDSTVEKLGELLKQNPCGLLLERDELSGWLRNLEREDRRGDREFFLEAWNGTNPYTYDRIGRGTIHIPALCVSIIGGIQPAKLARYVADAVEGGYAADGLLQRFQLLVWPEQRKAWKLVDQPPDLEARNAAAGVIRRLSQLPGPIGGEPVPALRFADDAQELFYEWLTQLEQRLRSDELRETPAFESHLSKYRSLMPSLSLLFHLIESEDVWQPVALASARLAADWCDFLEQHARKVYAAELQIDYATAHALAHRIREKAVVSGMTIRDIYNSGWSRLKTADAVMAGMSVLEEHGWARVEALPTGGRPKVIVAVNPQALEQKP